VYLDAPLNGSPWLVTPANVWLSEERPQPLPGGWRLATRIAS